MPHLSYSKKALILAFLASGLLSACDNSPKTAPEAAAQSQVSAPAETKTAEYRFADFVDGVTQLIPPEAPEAQGRNVKTTTLKTKQGAQTDAGSYAEKSGDDFIDHNKSIVTNGIASITGTLIKKNGSNYGGLLLITPSGKTPGPDLSEYKFLKITLASGGDHKNLQVRVIGANDQGVFRGCYPVANLTVTSEPQEYTIALTDEQFPQLSWCKDLVLPIAETLKAVRTVDVQDTNMPEKTSGETRVEIKVGSIRFTKE